MNGPLDRQAQLRNHIFQEMVTFYSSHPNIFKTLTLSLHFGTNIPVEKKRVVDDARDRLLVNYFMSCSDAENISILDQKILLNRNVTLMTNMVESIVLGNLSAFGLYRVEHNFVPAFLVLLTTKTGENIWPTL